MENHLVPKSLLAGELKTEIPVKLRMKVVLPLSKKRGTLINLIIYLKDCSHDAIATAIYLSQVKCCAGFSLIVTIASCEHQH